MKFAAFALSFIATLMVVVVPVRLSGMTDADTQMHRTLQYEYENQHEYEYHVVSGLQPRDDQQLRISDGWHSAMDALDFVFPYSTIDQPVYADISHVYGQVLRANLAEYEGACTGQKVEVIIENAFGGEVIAFEVDYVHIAPASQVTINGEMVTSWLLKPSLNPPEIGRTLEVEKVGCQGIYFDRAHLHQRVSSADSTADVAIQRETRIENRGDAPYSAVVKNIYNNEYWRVWRCASPSDAFWKVKSPAASAPNPAPSPPATFVETGACRTLIVEVPDTGAVTADPEAAFGYIQLPEALSAASRYERIYHRHGGSKLRTKGPPVGPPVEHRSLITLTAIPPAGHVVTWSDTGDDGTATASGLKYVVTMDSDRTVAVAFLYSAHPEDLLLNGESGILSASFTSSHWAEFELYRKKNGSFCTPGARGCSPDGTASAAAGDSPVSFGEQPSGTYRARSQGCIAASTSGAGGASGASGAGAVGGSSAASGSRIAASDECGEWSDWSPEFAHTAPTVTVTPAPTYRLTVTANPSSCGSARGTGDYIEGREVSIRASVKTNADCRFRNWTGDDIVNASSSSATVTMGNAPKTVTANFERIKYKLTIDISPPGCGRARGADDYAGGTPVSIRASASPGCRFDKWTGDGIVNASSSSATVTMGNAPKTVTANFVATTCTLTVVASPPKGGNATPATKTYSPCPSHKDLLATANPGYEFSSWTGDVSSASRSARVTLKDGVSKTVTANFTPTIKCPRDVFHTFEVNRNNSETLSAVTDGSGTITYSDGTGRPAWLGFTASTRTISGTPPRAGAWLFSIVATDADSNAVTCPYLVQGMKIPYTVTATVSPNAAWGSVSKSPTGRYYYGDSVTLTANASAGYRFVRWSGDASGSSATARVTVKDDVEVTATFAPRTYTLSVSVTKTARGYLHGSVTRTPWKAAYAYNDRVTLRANATPGYRFVKWSGAASGTAATARIVMNGSKTAKAHFELIPLPPCDPTVPGSCACPPGVICGAADDEDEGG